MSVMYALEIKELTGPGASGRPKFSKAYQVIRNIDLKRSSSTLLYLMSFHLDLCHCLEVGGAKRTLPAYVPFRKLQFTLQLLFRVKFNKSGKETIFRYKSPPTIRSGTYPSDLAMYFS